MSTRDNNNKACLLQLFLASALVFMVVFFCGALWYKSDVTIRVGEPPRSVPTPVPTVTSSPFYVIVEQARASATVQVITTEADDEFQMRQFWADYLILVLVIISTVVWLVAYKRGQE